jgi:hypothetical protein
MWAVAPKGGKKEQFEITVNQDQDNIFSGM